MVKKKDINFLKNYISTFSGKKYKNEQHQVVQLFEQRKINTIQTARKIIDQLGSKNKKTNISGLEKLNNYKTVKKEKTNKYFINGKAKMSIVYKSKKGNSVAYPGNFVPVEHIITSTTRDEAIQKFVEIVRNELYRSTERYDESVEEIQGVYIDKIINLSTVKTNSELDSLMKYVNPLTYEFIPNDITMLKHDNFCVVDQLEELYGKQLKKFRRENLINLIIQEEKNYSLDLKLNDWTIDQGVRARTINTILRKSDISFYAYDITKQCFDKFVSVNKNYKPLVYYSVNQHMYIINNNKIVKSLIEKSKNDLKIKSDMIEEYIKEESEERIQRIVYENIPIENLSSEEYKNALIIYNKPLKVIHSDGIEKPCNRTNITDILEDIIKIHNYIPDASNIKHGSTSAITQILFNFHEQNILLSIDPNYNVVDFTHSDVQEIVRINNSKSDKKLEFKNQSIGAISLQLRKMFFEKERIKFSKKQRNDLLIKFNNECNICKDRIIDNKFHIDHIEPLSAGGNNSDDNLQVLCIECHFEKTKLEQEEHQYIKVSETSSSFNNQVSDIVNSELFKTFSFVEVSKSNIDKNKKLYKIDINKSRKNAIYFNKQLYPLFTVMDQVEHFLPSETDYTKPGIYYIESSNKFPLRSNGWYSHVLTKYCIDKQIIQLSDIKYHVHSSLTIPSDYFNKFIDYVYKHFGKYSKQIINCMIGIFAVVQKQRYKTLAITSDKNVAFYHCLNKTGSYVNELDIGSENPMYQVFEKYRSETEETENILYKCVLENEIINLYELSELITYNGHTVVELNTDAILFESSDKTFPFKLDSNKNLVGYYFDDEGKFPKYKTEKPTRLKISRKSGYVRNDQYVLEPIKWNVKNDPMNDDFAELVDNIIMSNKSICIEGQGGTGKSHLVKMLMTELNNRGINYLTIAPTNKSARIVNGITCARFCASFNLKNFKKHQYKYLFVDEISMCVELYYKFFLFLKNVIPELKFVLSGHFEQLLPVGDRLGEKSYEHSRALYEICDSNKLILSKCRRCDNTLFNLIKPENIPNIRKEQFGNKFTERHICWTNAKRIAINNICMKSYIKKKKIKPLILEKLSYDKNSQRVMLATGMNVISRINAKSLDIYNNELFKIKKIDKNIITVFDDSRIIDIPVDKFQRMFYVSFALTVHKVQGETIREPFTIHEWSRFSNRMKYVSLSRSTCKNDINII